MKHALVAVAFLLLQLVAAASTARSSEATSKGARSSLPGYDLSNPISSFLLPDELEEISGMTDIDEHTVACVQDERGRIFYVDLRSGRVWKSRKFAGRGDYEGLTRVGDALWVLRSDGLLLELMPAGNAPTVRRQVALDVEHRDIEGLGYDPFREVLLVAPKDPPSGGKGARGQRRVFMVDPKSGKQQASPALSTSVDRIVRDAKRAGIALPRRSGKKGKVSLKARFSSIAVHPRTGRLYVASAADSTLLVLDRDGRLCAAHVFDDRELPKIEGISFTANGNLVISSEGVDSPSRIQVFRYAEGTPAACAGA